MKTISIDIMNTKIPSVFVVQNEMYPRIILKKNAERYPSGIESANASQYVKPSGGIAMYDQNATVQTNNEGISHNRRMPFHATSPARW